VTYNNRTKKKNALKRMLSTTAKLWASGAMSDADMMALRKIIQKNLKRYER
jgi:hypothetical protein